MAGNRTQVNCLEGSYAHHYTTIASVKEKMFACHGEVMSEGRTLKIGEKEKKTEERDGLSPHHVTLLPQVSKL